MKPLLAGKSGRALLPALSGPLLPAAMPAAVFSLTATDSGFINAEGRSSKNDGVVLGASPAALNDPAGYIGAGDEFMFGFTAPIIPGVVSPDPSFPGSTPIPVLMVTTVPEPSAVFMLVGALAVFFLLKRGAGRR